MSNKNKYNTIRLSKSSNYERPGITLTDSLQSNQKYKDKLTNYIEVSDVDFVTIGTHVRYFKFDTKNQNWMFRCGGLLTYKHQKYVVLSNGKYSWSVQREIEHKGEIYETKFFKILNVNEKKDIEIKKRDSEIAQLKLDNQKMAEKLQLLINNFHNK